MFWQKKKEIQEIQVSGNYQEAKFIVLGACCKKSQDNFSNVCQAVQELGFEDKVLNIGDNLIIAQYGVMQTPALVLEQKVVSQGKFISVQDAKKYIENLKS